MRGSGAFRTSIVPGGALAGPWVANSLWKNARAVPSLDLRFAENKSLTDAKTGASLVTFTRASTGTFVGSDGLLRSAVTNLLLRSEEFDTGWTGSESNTTITANTNTAPNGTLTADTIDFTNASSFRYQIVSNTPGGTTVTFSVWLASGTKTQTVIRIAGSSTGTGGQLVISLTPTLTRYSVTVTIPSGNSAAFVGFENRVGIGGGNGGTGTIVAWGAQLEQSSTVGEYIPTTSVINSAPRFDHNPTTGESLGLLVEEARTNLALWSEDLSNAVWSVNFTSVTTNAVTAPDGGLTADFVKEDSSSFEHNRFQNASVTAGTVYTISAYAKAGGRTKFILRTAIAGGNINCGFDLTSGTVTRQPSGFTCSIQRLPNGWYRCSATCTASVTASRYFALQLAIADPVDDAQPSYQGDNTSGLFLWGAQLEAGAFLTSYIPTTSATATRAADVASITGTNFSSWYNQTEGTVLLDGRFNTVATNTALVSINDAANSSNNRHTLRIGNTIIVSGGTTVASFFQTPALQAIAKYAYGYAVNNFVQVLNSTSTSVDTLGAVPAGVNVMEIGKVEGTQIYSNGTIKRLTYWPVRLANPTLQAITSP